MAIKRTLKATRSSVSIECAYRKKLDGLIDRMQRSVVWWLRAAYRRREGQIVMDAAPARDLSQELQSVMRDWQRDFNAAAEDIARWFAEQNSRHVRNSTKEAFKAAGLEKLITVKFRYMNRRERDVLQSIIVENVNLIKSIPQHYLTEVQGLVQRSVQNGRDLGYLTEELQKRYGITKRRAATIARDQTNKATENLSRARMQSLGITKGIWIHTSAGKTYRETHVKMDGKEFDLSKGLYDSAVGREVFPGELVNCFPGDSKLYGFPFIEKLFRRPYSGELTELVTENGAVLRVTPNHPILTSKGWKPARFVDCGDYLVQINRESSYIRELNCDGAIPTFEEFFEAFVGHGVPTSILNSAECDFHGDMSNGNIDVIDVDSFLSDEGNPTLRECVANLGFSGAEVRNKTRMFSAQCPTAHFLMGVSGTANRIMSRTGKGLPIFFCSLDISEFIRFACSASSNVFTGKMSSNNLSGAVKAPGDSQFTHSRLVQSDNFIVGHTNPVGCKFRARNLYSSLPHIDGQVIGSNPKLFSDCFEHLTLGKAFYRVVDKRISEFSGHVYNLQTSLGWYIADYTVVHNCRCTYKPIIT